MKLSRILFLSAVSLILSVSCSQEKPLDIEDKPTDPTPSTTPADENISFSASLEDISGPQSGLKGWSAPTWSKGDAVAFFASGTKSRFVISEGIGTKKASFSGKKPGSGPYYAFYPYSDGCSLANGSISFNLLQNQEFPSRISAEFFN